MIWDADQCKGPGFNPPYHKNNKVSKDKLYQRLFSYYKLQNVGRGGTYL